MLVAQIMLLIDDEMVTNQHSLRHKKLQNKGLRIKSRLDDIVNSSLLAQVVQYLKADLHRKS